MPLTDIVPLQLADAGTTDERRRARATGMVTQFSMKPVEELGLLKMDFLGLRNLDVIEDALDIIERSDRRAARHDDAAARRRRDLRDAGPRRLGRRVPVRVRGHAGGAASKVAPDGVRRPRRARRAVPPGRDGPDPDLRARQARPGLGLDPRRAPGADHRPDLRRDPVPGAGHADLQGARRLQRAPRPTTCARRSARRTARRWPSSSRSSARAARPAARARRSSTGSGRRTRSRPTTRSTSPTRPATR